MCPKPFWTRKCIKNETIIEVFSEGLDLPSLAEQWSSTQKNGLSCGTVGASNSAALVSPFGIKRMPKRPNLPESRHI